jgi:hypothetical protein
MRADACLPVLSIGACFAAFLTGLVLLLHPGAGANIRLVAGTWKNASPIRHGFSFLFLSLSLLVLARALCLGRIPCSLPFPLPLWAKLRKEPRLNAVPAFFFSPSCSGEVRLITHHPSLNGFFLSFFLQQVQTKGFLSRYPK